MQTVKKHAQHGFSQFKLTQHLLNNLQQFEITPTAKLVLLYLSSCFNPKKADMFPKQKTIADKLGISERSVVRAIQELFNAGLIVIECKYSNRYKFTSRIVSQPSQNEYFFEGENMSDDLSQNDTKLDDKMSAHKHEPMREPKNEPVISVDDFKILKEYALKHGAKNVSKYVDTLKRNGAAEKILKQYKEKEAADRFYERQIRETKERNAKNRVWIAENPKDCTKLQEVLARIKA